MKKKIQRPCKAETRDKKKGAKESGGDDDGKKTKNAGSGDGGVRLSVRSFVHSFKFVVM